MPRRRPACAARSARAARDIFWQHLTEVGRRRAGRRRSSAGCWASAGIWALRAWYGHFVDDAARALPFDRVNFLDHASPSRVVAGLLAGLYPAWRIGRAAPASYLKVQ